MLNPNLQRHLSWERSQSAEPQQVVGSADKMGMQLHSSDAAKARATQPAPALHPAEDLLDPLALSLADRVTGVASGARIQPRGVAALNLRDVRADAAAAQPHHEGLVVIALVRAQTDWLQTLAPLALEQLGGRGAFGLQCRAHADIHAQSVAVLHQGMSAKAQLRFLAGPLARGLGLRIGIGGMGVVAARAAAKVHPTPTVRGRRWTVLGPEALLSRPRLDQCAVHGQMLRG